MRDYTVAEIEELRTALANKMLWGRYALGVIGASGEHTMNRVNPVAVEAQVQTHMMAGHTAETLLSEERQAQAAWEAQFAQA